MSERKNVLVVDDDPDIVDQISAILTADGYQVSAAHNRSEAEELLLAFRPDLAILDVMMETPDAGLVLAYHVQKLRPETPVILLTSVKATAGISLHASVAEMRSWVGAETVLDKPVRPEQIRAEVRRLLKEPDATRADAHP